MAGEKVSKTPRAKEEGVVAAYLANKTIPEIEIEFGVGRTTIYHILRRSGQVPARTQRRMDGAARDAALAGLYELIAHQDRVIAEHEHTIEQLNSKLRAAERKVASKQKAAG